MKISKWFVIMVIFTFLIWTQSLLNGNISTEESSFITDIAMRIVDFFLIDIPYNDLHHIIRKIAHFTEYFILGILWYKYLLSQKESKENRVIVMISVIIFTAGIDELIQLIHESRTASITDFLIDICGAFSGLLVFLLSKMLYNKHVKKI